MLKVPTFAVVLAVLLAMSGDSRSQEPPPSGGEPSSPQQSQTSPSQQTSEPDHRGTEQAPLIVRSLKSQEEASQDAKDRQDKAANDRINLSFTALVAVATFLQLCALGVIIRTTRRQLRAYVFVTGRDFTVQDDKGGKYIHHLKAINTGQTPAKDLVVECVSRILPHPVDAEFDFPLPPQSQTKAFLQLGRVEM
jgi:hypothetical protein